MSQQHIDPRWVAHDTGYGERTRTRPSTITRSRYRPIEDPITEEIQMVDLPEPEPAPADPQHHVVAFLAGAGITLAAILIETATKIIH